MPNSHKQSRNVLTCLVFAPHHDDEVIGCGGLLLTLSRTSWTLAVAVAFDPLEGRESEAGRKRLLEATRAGQILGVSQHINIGLPCRIAVTQEDLTWKLVELLRKVRPSMLLVPHLKDRDPEHIMINRAATEALWLAPSKHKSAFGDPATPVELVLGYEVWAPIENIPPLRVDISTHIDDKLRAIRCYDSQNEGDKLAMAVAGLNRYRGSMDGMCEYAEAYTVMRMESRLLDLINIK